MPDSGAVHHVVVDALVDAYLGVGPELRGVAGGEVIGDLVSAHRLWSRWLQVGRVRKFAVVAEKVRASRSDQQKPAR